MSKPTAAAFSLRLLGLAVVLAVCVLAVHPDSAAATSGCVGLGTTTYYSDASHSTIVGSCSTGCCLTFPSSSCPCQCTGSTSAFFTHTRPICP
jgi:hypothetical protein